MRGASSVTSSYIVTMENNMHRAIRIFFLLISSLALTLTAAAQQEPAGIKGYITWTDPATSRHHIITGQDTRSGNTVFAEQPVILVYFTGSDWPVTVDGTFAYTAINAAGRDLGANASNWRLNDPPVAFRYQVNFQHDLGYTGNPVLLSDNRTIRYNPSRNQFRDIKTDIPYDKSTGPSGGPSRSYRERTGIDVPVGDFIDRPIVQGKRKTPFTDLPNF